jgi:nucleotide-binding universal stress UspA family protein
MAHGAPWSLVMKILLAVDGSEYTKRMLAWLAVHPEMLGADAEHACINVTPELPPHVTRYLDDKTEDAYYAEQAHAVFAPIEEFGRRHGWKMSMLPAVGLPAEEIAKRANAGGFDLLMMGSHGHSALGNLFLGSVAACKTPVLIIR